jgi:3-oxoacyl-[acyl-carrier-protein] synthase-1
MPVTPLPVTAYTLSNALGLGKAAVLERLQGNHSGLRPCDFEGVNFDCWIGRVAGIEQAPVRADLSEFDCRNNRLAQIGLEQDGFAEAVERAGQRYGKERIGLFLGTSTSGIQEAEIAYAQRDRESDALPAGFSYQTTQNCYSLTGFCRRYLGIGGPAFSISTACSSSSKVFAAAQRHLDAGLCDAAVVGGVDSLCLTTLYGFNSLGLIAEQACTPWGLERNGISIGEASGFALLERDARDSSLALLGYGESSDAYHMSTPHPEGAGAAQAIEQALLSAGLQAGDLDYINLHGTGTRLNDASEDRSLQHFQLQAACSSTKGWTGHTLGAAGITEAAITLLAIENGFLPGNLGRGEADPELVTAVHTQTSEQKVELAMSNSFGFGGSNCSLLFGRRP